MNWQMSLLFNRYHVRYNLATTEVVEYGQMEKVL